MGPADDPLGAFRAAAGAVQDALDDPATADQEYEGFSGPTKFADGVDNFLSADLVRLLPCVTFDGLLRHRTQFLVCYAHIGRGLALRDYRRPIELVVTCSRVPDVA